MELCPAFNFIAHAHESKERALLVHLRCKRWSCAYCANQNQKQWRAFLLKKLPEIGQYWYFVTLTAHSAERTTVKSLKNLASNIGRILKRFKRAFGKIEYVRVYERHPTSEAVHAHLLVHGLTDYVAVGFSSRHQKMNVGIIAKTTRFAVWSLNTYVKQVAFECGIGYIADAKRLQGGAEQAVGYATKYMTKEMQGIHVRGLRHIQTSRGIGSPGPTNKLLWQVGEFVTARQFKPGQELVIMPGDVRLPDDYWQEHNTYPAKYELYAWFRFSTAQAGDK